MILETLQRRTTANKKPPLGKAKPRTAERLMNGQCFTVVSPHAARYTQLKKGTESRNQDGRAW